MTRFVLAESYLLPHEAHIAKASLESEGIPAFIADEHTVTGNWLYAHAIGGVKVMVAPEHKARAQEILATDYSDTVDEELGLDIEHCPRCGCEEVEPYVKGKKPAFVIFALLHFPFWRFKRGMKCERCGHFWRT